MRPLASFTIISPAQHAEVLYPVNPGDMNGEIAVMLEGSRSQLGMLIGAGPGRGSLGTPLWRRPGTRPSGHYESPVSGSRPVGGRMAMPTLGASDPFSDLSWTTTSMVLPLRSPLTGAAMRWAIFFSPRRTMLEREYLRFGECSYHAFR